MLSVLTPIKFYRQ